MFRINVIKQGRWTTLCLEGTLARERVKEARRAWEALRAGEHSRRLKVDVRALYWFDADGLALLGEVQDSQAQIVCGLLMRQLVQKHSLSKPDNKLTAGRIAAPALALLTVCLFLLIQQRPVLDKLRASNPPAGHETVTARQHSPSPTMEPTASTGNKILTTLELDVLRGLAGGNSNRDIAEKLLMPEDSVQDHIEHIMDKLGAADRAQAVLIGIRRGIIQL